jgi:hypothetical protein
LHKKGSLTKVENFESRAFPQAFLNHLETAASYPDSSGLAGLRADSEIFL